MADQNDIDLRENLPPTPPKGRGGEATPFSHAALLLNGKWDTGKPLDIDPSPNGSAEPSVFTRFNSPFNLKAPVKGDYCVDDEEYTAAMLSHLNHLERVRLPEFHVLRMGVVLADEIGPAVYFEYCGHIHDSLADVCKEDGPPMNLVHLICYALMGDRALPALKSVDEVWLSDGSWLSDLEEPHCLRALIILEKHGFEILEWYPYCDILGRKYCCGKSIIVQEDTYKLRLQFALGYVGFTRAPDGSVVRFACLKMQQCNLLGRDGEDFCVSVFVILAICQR